MSEKKLNDFYENSLIPKLETFEKSRRKMLFWALVISIIFACACYLLAIHIKIDSKTLGPIIFTALLPYLLITEKYKLGIQKKVMNAFMTYFDNFQYTEDECIPDYKLAKSKLFEFNTNETLSAFSGCVNGQKTTISICKLNVVDKETAKRTTTFNGIISCVLTNCYFHSHTIIINNVDTAEFAGLSRIESKDLNVFSSNPADAEKLVTPEFTKWFVSLKEVFNSEKFAVTFFENTMLIAVYTEELKCFEFKSTYQKICFSAKMQAMYDSLAKLLEANYLPLPISQDDEEK